MAHFGATSPQSLLLARNIEQEFFIMNSRLKIPVSFHQETITTAGPGATNFPMHITVGASWNTTLAQSLGSAIALEAHALGIDAGYSPEINLYTDPRHGRGQEAFSEDPFLTAELGVAWVLGQQGGTADGGIGPQHYLPEGKIASVGKHFMGFGASQGGLGEGPATVDEYTLRDVYMRPWEAVVQRAGLRAAMRSHQAWNHWPLHAHKYLADIINKAGFNDSWSISDCGDIMALMKFEVAGDETQAAALGLNASVDMENRCGTTNTAYEHLIEAIHAGQIDEATLNISVARVLRHKFAAGLFDKPYVDESELENLRIPSTLSLAQEAAAQGIVLLKNGPPRDNHTLPSRSRDAPLPIDLPSYAGKLIAVIGPLGGCQDNPGFGDSNISRRYCTLEGACEASCALLGKTFQPIGDGALVPTLWDVMHNAVSLLGRDQSSERGKITVEYARGAHIDPSSNTTNFIRPALKLAARADLIIMVMGDNVHSAAEGFRPGAPHGHGNGGDRDSLDLPGNQQRLMHRVLRVRRKGVPAVAVLINGRPVTFDAYGTISGTPNGLLSELDAVVATYRGGEFGSAALWDVLTGTTQPSGRLPQSWPRKVGQVGGPSSPGMHQVVGNWADDAAQQFVIGYYYSDATPLFPFGFGLSYTFFTYRSVFVKHKLSSDSMRSNDDLLHEAKSLNAVVAQVDVSVVNIGERGGYTVVQVYAHDPKNVGVVRYNRRLVGFAKEYVGFGETCVVTVDLTADALAFLSPPPAYERKLHSGRYRLFVGQSANDDQEIETHLKL
mmetsp:Transcript_29199/g.56072  ORF Transcript_29199/g.56072 Transcript_29199/m.56072 type:complete len:783 (-) Transcript_29199:165-2513(-)